MLATSKPPDQNLKSKQKASVGVILEPGGQMPLDHFFEKWIPMMYGIEKDPFAVQTAKDFRTGQPLLKTWRQICVYELELWNFNQVTTKHWGSRWQSAPESAKRLAYFMNALLQEKLSEQKKTREEARD